MVVNRPLLRILGAQGLSSLGTSISTVALAVMVFDLTGSVMHMGGVLAASAAPLVFMTFVGGALLDRWESRRLMVAADLGRAALIMLMPFAAMQTVGLIYVVAALMGTLGAVFNPSQVKMVSEAVDSRRLVKANSYLSISREGAELGGYLVGGALVASLGYVATFMIDAATYGLSALFLLGLPRVWAGRDKTSTLRRLLRESPRAVGEIWGALPLRANLLFALLPMTIVMMSLPNAYGLALDVYDKGAEGFALMEVITSAGWIVGGIFASRMDYGGDRNKYVFWSLIAMAACFAVVGVVGSFWVSVVFLALAAVGNVGVIVGSMTLFQEIPERADKGRIIAVRAGFGQVAVTAGILLGGLIGAAFGITRTFLVIGLVATAAGLLVYVPYWLGLRRRGAEMGSADAAESGLPGPAEDHAGGSAGSAAGSAAGSVHV